MGDFSQKSIFKYTHPPRIKKKKVKQHFFNDLIFIKVEKFLAIVQ